MLHADRVQETSTTTGTGTLTLAGAVAAYRAFSAAFSDGDTVRYAIVSGTDWEVGEGIYSAGTLTRATVFASSNANALVTLAAGTKNVWCDAPAASLNELGSYARTLTSIFTVTSTAPTASNLAFPIAAGETWDVEFSGLVSSGAVATGMKFSLQAPGGSTCSGYVDGCTTGITARSGAGITAINTVSATAFCTTSSTTVFVMMKMIVTAVSAGTVAIGLATASGATGMSILAGAKMIARRSLKV